MPNLAQLGRPDVFRSRCGRGVRRPVMRILFVSPRQCWPPLTGARLREYHLLRSLAGQAQLTHVFFSQPPLLSPSADFPLCPITLSVPQPSLYTPAKVVRGLLGKWPLPVVNYMAPEMETTIKTILTEVPFDLIHLDSIHMAAYAPMIARATRAPIVYDWHNIESEVMRRYSAIVNSPLRKLYAAVTASRLSTLERRLLRDGFGHLVCSEREREQLHQIVPGARIAVIENGVDTIFFSSFEDVPQKRFRLVYVGSMNYLANIEAVTLFVRNVWPLVLTEFPNWRLTVVGSNPTPTVLALSNETNVEVTGTVPDVRTFYREAVAAIVPLCTGGGTRLKILEAMAAGVPVVSTSLGAEGLGVSPGHNILIADKDEEWLPHLSALSSQNALWRRLAANGRDLVSCRYDWALLGHLLVNTYRQWLGAIAP